MPRINPISTLTIFSYYVFGAKRHGTGKHCAKELARVSNNNYSTGNAPARMSLQTIPATEVTLGLLSWWNFKDLVTLTASFA